MDDIEARLVAAGGVLDRRRNRDVSGRIDRLLRTGRLVPVLPGVYCLPEGVTSPLLLLRAATVWAGPDAVLTGWAAAKVTFWPTCPMSRVTLAVPASSGLRSAGLIEVVRRRVPPTLIWRRSGLACTAASLTAVDLADTDRGGEAIDQALRSRMATIDQMWSVLRELPQRRGNQLRARLLVDSRDSPWSEAEREGHRLLRRAGIRGWRTNVAVGRYWVDILFDRERVIVEIDGWETHGTRQAFEDDRRRRNELELAGYTVLNFTWAQLVDDPGWVVSCIQLALAGVER